MVSPTERVLNRVMLSLILLFLAAVMAVGGMYAWIKALPPRLEQAFPQGIMFVGVDPSYPPFAVDTGETMIGLDIDLAVALAEEMGIPFQFVPVSFDGLYDSVMQGRVDVVISALLINPAKMNDVRYTRPYYNNGLVLVTENSQIYELSDLANLRLALEYGSQAESEARYWLRRITPFEVLPYELPDYALDAVRLGQAEAALVDTTTYGLYLKNTLAWQAEEHIVTDALYAAAVRIDRLATWTWLDNALKTLQENGKLQAIIDEWL